MVVCGDGRRLSCLLARTGPSQHQREAEDRHPGEFHRIPEEEEDEHVEPAESGSGPGQLRRFRYRHPLSASGQEHGWLDARTHSAWRWSRLPTVDRERATRRVPNGPRDSPRPPAARTRAATGNASSRSGCRRYPPRVTSLAHIAQNGLHQTRDRSASRQQGSCALARGCSEAVLSIGSLCLPSTSGESSGCPTTSMAGAQCLSVPSLVSAPWHCEARSLGSEQPRGTGKLHRQEWDRGRDRPDDPWRPHPRRDGYPPLAPTAELC